MTATTEHVCDCCEPPAPATPIEVYNRPALSAIAYRIGTFSSFRQAMLQQLAGEPALVELGTRESDDYAITFLELFAAVGDVLTFYQERYANEGFLRTARFRDSVARLGALIDYRLKPGVAARAWLALALDEGARVEVAARQKVQSVPQGKELPQTYETLAPLQADARWNRLRVLPLPSATNPLQSNRRHALLDPAHAAQLATEITAGDRVVLFNHNTADPTEVKEVERLELEGDRARLHWTLGVAKDTWSATTRAFRCRRSFRVFGHNAPAQVMTPSYQGGRIVWSLDDTGYDVAAGSTLDLDGVVDGLEVGQELMVAGGDGTKRQVTITAVEQAHATVETGSGQPALSGAATRLHVLPIHTGGDRRGIQVLELLGSRIRFATADYPPTLGGEAIYLPGVVVEDETLGRGVEVARRIGRAGLERGLALYLAEVEPGRRLLLADADADTEPVAATIQGAPAIEPGNAAVGDPCHLKIELDADGPLQLDRDSGFLLGNVVQASHGETVIDEVLGGGDRSATFQRFTLKKPPLTFLPAASAEGSASTLELRVDRVRWQEVPRLYGRRPDEQVFELRHGDDGTTTVQFGDGLMGARLPTGTGSVRASYRFGAGLAGRVPAGSLTTLLQKPVGLASAVNPLAAEGGADAESLANARENAPRTVRTFGRVVSLADFEDLARASGEVAKAKATRTWDGLERLIHLTVAAQGGAPLSAGARDALRAALDAARAPHVRLVIDDFQPVPVRLRAGIGIDPRYVAGDVLAAAHAAVVDALSFDRQRLGQSLHLSDFYRVLQRVDGVLFVDVDLFHFKPPEGASFLDLLIFLFLILRRGATLAPVQDHLRIFGARPADDAPGTVRPAELAVLASPDQDAIVEQRSA